MKSKYYIARIKNKFHARMPKSVVEQTHTHTHLRGIDADRIQQIVQLRQMRRRAEIVRRTVVGSPAADEVVHERGEACARAFTMGWQMERDDGKQRTNI